MTTKDDWEFRANHLEHRAKGLDARADLMRQEASDLRLAAKICEANAKFSNAEKPKDS